jgi:sortase A
VLAARLVIGALVLSGTLSLALGAWMPAKARLAQVLLDHAWHETLHSGSSSKPWPWADTWPVARLSAPAQGKAMIVLAGANGAALAFGPGHLSTSAPPGVSDNSVIVGHRDTHFAFLKALKPGDALQLEAADGIVHDYQVISAHVVHETDSRVLQPSRSAMLTLITCFPLDAVVPGGPLRYVVRARGIPPHNT